MTSTRILGIDPGLNRMGWGIVDCSGNRLQHVAHGVIVSKPDDELAARLAALYAGLVHVVAQFLPDEAAVEEVFVNRNPASTLKLGMARGIALVVPATGGIKVAEYSANLVKKSVVGAGHADKDQVAMMIARILPGSDAKADAADALAVAVCHAHHRASAALSKSLAPTGRGGRANVARSISPAAEGGSLRNAGGDLRSRGRGNRADLERQ